MIPTSVRRFVHPRRWWLRLPVKLTLLCLIVLAATYPRPDLLVRNIKHWRNLDALIDPDCPALAPLATELAPRLEGVPKGKATLKVVQDFVLEKIPYAWDWETWGVLDYIPTVEETLAKGREDCDGRAVVAASLLRKLGYKAKLKSDLSHVWVWTPAGETMSPVQTASGMTVIAPTAKGSGINWKAVFAGATLLRDMPASVGYGIAVFPAWRELAVILLGLTVLAGRIPRPRMELMALLAVIAGWQTIRWTCADAWDRNLTGAWMGFGLVAVGVAVMVRSWWGGAEGAEGLKAAVRSPDEGDSATLPDLPAVG